MVRDEFTDSDPSGSVRDSHIVPRFYLNKFADVHKRVWVYTEEYQPQHRSTKSQTTAPYYYDYVIGNVATKGRHERWLKSLEDPAAMMYPKLLSGNALTLGECSNWAMFVASLFLRSDKVRTQMTPRTVEQVRTALFGEDAIANMQLQLLGTAGFIPRSILRIKLNEFWQEREHSIAFFHMSHIDRSTRNLASILLRKNWYTLSCDEKTSFITSDSPVYTLKIESAGLAYDGYGFGQDDVSAFLPLSANKLWVATPNGRWWQTKVDAKTVETLNRAAISFAHRKVFTRTLVEGIDLKVRQGINRSIFGETAFRTPHSQVHP